jgi:hypothetical protein
MISLSDILQNFVYSVVEIGEQESFLLRYNFYTVRIKFYLYYAMI